MPIGPSGERLPYPGDPGFAGGGEAEPSVEEDLRLALQMLESVLQREPDDVDSQALARVVQGLYGILAGRQKESQSLMGGGNMRALSRAYGG